MPLGWGMYCTDNEECIPAQGIHIHADNAACIKYLRKDERFADVRDDKCCACYFERFLDYGGHVDQS